MPRCLFHVRFCPFVYLATHCCFLGDPCGGNGQSLFLFLPVYPEQASPGSTCTPPNSLSSANVRGIDILFIIPSKLSLFPSLSFMISTVSSETDGQSLPISLCQRQPRLRSGGCRAGRAALLLMQRRSPHRDVPWLTKQQWMGSE